MSYEKFCDTCERVMRLTEDGYCRGCGKHADNMRQRTRQRNCDECGELYPIISEDLDDGFCTQDCEQEFYQKSYYRRL